MTATLALSGTMRRGTPPKGRACGHRSNRQAFARHPHRRRRHSNPTGDLTDRYATNELQPKNFAHLAHGGSLCGHPVPPLEAKGADLSRPAEAPDPRARSSRNGGRHHLGTVGEIISESVGDIIPE